MGCKPLSRVIPATRAVVPPESTRTSRHEAGDDNEPKLASAAEGQFQNVNQERYGRGSGSWNGTTYPSSDLEPFIMREACRETNSSSSGRLGMWISSDRDVVRGTFGHGDSPLVVDLRRGDVSMAEQILDFPHIDAGAEQQRRRRGA